MKQATLTMVLNVPDDFKTGDCDNCPLSATHCEVRYGKVEEITACKIGCVPMTCLLRENKE